MTSQKEFLQKLIEALKDRTMFNIIDTQMGWKADLIVRKKRDYSKLEWSRVRESQTQLKDALGVLMVQWNTLDFGYLEKWAKELDVENSLKQLMKEAKKLKPNNQ
jgi:hypothetical protein